MKNPKMKETHWQKAGIVAVIASIIVFLGWLSLGSTNWAANIMSSTFWLTFAVLFVLLALVDYLWVKKKGKLANRIEWLPDLIGAFLAALATWTVMSWLGVTLALGPVGWIATVIIMFVLIYIGEWVGCYLERYL
jgi:hypothetical protein